MAKGFNKGPQMGQGGMMQQLQKMQKQMEEAQAKLAEETVQCECGRIRIIIRHIHYSEITHSLFNFSYNFFRAILVGFFFQI